jgi:hypothetical protein
VVVVRVSVAVDGSSDVLATLAVVGCACISVDVGRVAIVGGGNTCMVGGGGGSGGVIC